MMKRREKRLLATHWIELSRRSTPEGQEKLCPRCGEWMLHNEQNFSFMQTRGHFRSYCKPCNAELTARYKEKRAMRA